MLIELFITFAKIGMFTFGGGYAMISLIEHECVENKQWITSDELMDVTVIAESTPGPIAINCATYTGYKKAGIDMTKKMMKKTPHKYVSIAFVIVFFSIVMILNILQIRFSTIYLIILSGFLGFCIYSVIGKKVKK